MAVEKQGELPKILHVFVNNHSGMQPGGSVLDFLREPELPPEHFFSLVDEGVHGLIRFSVLYAVISEFCCA